MPTLLHLSASFALMFLGVEPAASPHIGVGTWSWPPLVILPLLFTAGLYWVGLIRLRSRNGSIPIPTSHIAFFSTGFLTLLLALDSPLHELSEQLFWVHMTQHEVLMLISAPLLALAHPNLPFLWAFPLAVRKRIGAGISSHVFRRFWNAFSAPASSWTLHGLALWIWHIPLLFDATLNNEAIHAAQHICFLGSALLFWYSLVNKAAARNRWGMSVLYVFTTAVHTSLLGALLTFSPRPWYAPYAATAPAWHLSALQDQQLGGLIMWIPAGVILFAVTLVFFAKWMNESDSRWKSNLRTAPFISETGADRGVL